jgi:Mitochondrial ribosomal protein (VAR1)
MYNNENWKTTKPLIFNKKLNDNLKIIPLNSTRNTLGPIKYFPSATQEWYNSIYAYNNSYIKNITIADKNLSRLIKSYFNLYFSKKLSYSKRILTRFRRLAINKIFFSKAELKHTSTKVIITLYVYNEERRILLHRLKRIEAMLFYSTKFSASEVYNNGIIPLNKKLSIIKNQNKNLSFKSWLEEIKEHIFEEIKLEKKVLETINKLNLKKNKLLEIETLQENINSILSILSSCENDPISLKHYENIYYKFINKTLLEKEIATITYYKLLLSLNKYKFEDKFIFKLKPLISKIYNKEIEFNIVNLKAIYLNSDIFTQAISLKLKNRNNRLLKVLRSFLYMVKLPKVNVLKERFNHINIKNLWVNRVKNLRINPLVINNKDNLNQLLVGLFTGSNFLNKLEKNQYDKDKVSINTNLLSYVFNIIKYKSMGGVRLEAKGRLTRRFTASRSVFKIKWKGSLKNIDSSYRGLSSVILRGHAKSNVQYSIVNSKTRNGAFGLKGWISAK